MKGRYQYRFYPTTQQKISLAQLFGCVRVVYNEALSLCKKEGKKLKYTDLTKIVLTEAKKDTRESVAERSIKYSFAAIC